MWWCILWDKLEKTFCDHIFETNDSRRHNSIFVDRTVPVDDLALLGSKTSVGAATWWRHEMETFSALLAICAGNSPVPGEFPAQRPVTRSFDIFFDLRLNKWLSKQSWGWWFERQSRPLWRHSNDELFGTPRICGPKLEVLRDSCVSSSRPSVAYNRR